MKSGKEDRGRWKNKRWREGQIVGDKGIEVEEKVGKWREEETAEGRKEEWREEKKNRMKRRRINGM